jgi:cytochrome bd ubiquinol oxidase subunit II
MSVAGFILISVIVAVYVLLDGYDLGVATLAPFVARDDRERDEAMASIGPFWNGNEVWLIAAGACLFALFPRAYASSFSGFYLPFMIVLWLLMFRGIALELRNHFPSEIWHGFWDAAFTGASALLIVLFGIALGNLLRGIPLDADGYFRGTFAFLLNPYALVVALFALFALVQHGAAFLILSVRGVLAERSRRALLSLVWIVTVLYVASTAATLALRWVPARGADWLVLLPVFSFAALAGVYVFARRGDGLRAFASSSAFLATLLIAAAGTLYPYLIPGYPADTGTGLTIFAASPAPVALATAVTLTVLGVAGVLVYGTLVFRRFLQEFANR